MINPNTLHIKMIDFGLSCGIVDNVSDDEYVGTSSNPPMFIPSHSHVMLGTPIYMAPKVLEAADTLSEFDLILSDLWSVGVVLWVSYLFCVPDGPGEFFDLCCAGASDGRASLC